MVNARHPSALFEPDTEDEVDTELAVVPVFVFAGVATTAVVDADDGLLLALDEELVVVVVLAVVAALLEVLLVADGLDVTVAADEVDELSSATEEEPQPLSAEPHATRPICTLIMTFPTLITIVTHFRYCRVYERKVVALGARVVTQNGLRRIR